MLNDLIGFVTELTPDLACAEAALDNVGVRDRLALLVMEVMQDLLIEGVITLLAITVLDILQKGSW